MLCRALTSLLSGSFAAQAASAAAGDAQHLRRDPELLGQGVVYSYGGLTFVGPGFPGFGSWVSDSGQGTAYTDGRSAFVGLGGGFVGIGKGL